MSEPGTMVIVGAGLAGAKAAEGARSAGYEGRIILVGDEPHLPYERPPLSKGLLRGESTAIDAAVHPSDFYADNDIEVVFAVVQSVDPAGRAVTLASAETIGFDTAVMATGAASRRLDVPGAELAGVHHLRTLEDASELNRTIASATRVAVIGAGWIGTEVAASARAMGTEVVLIDPASVPLQRVLGDEIGAVFAELHADHGVVLRLGLGVAAITGDRRVEAVLLSDGSTEPVDAAVVGIGVVPRTEALGSQGLIVVDDGIVVDECLQTDVHGVYAAGDVANAFHPLYRRHLRVEHWANALHQGAVAGSNAGGRSDRYDRLPYFYSDQYDLGLEYVGHAGAHDRPAIRGDLSAREFIAVWHHRGNVTAAMHVNSGDVVDDLKAIVEQAGPIDIEQFTNTDSPLSDLTS